MNLISTSLKNKYLKVNWMGIWVSKKESMLSTYVQGCIILQFEIEPIGWIVHVILIVVWSKRLGRYDEKEKPYCN